MKQVSPDAGQGSATSGASQGGGGQLQGGLPISGGLLAIVFAGALLMLRQEALNPTRPSMAVPPSVDAQAETVRARLWQDPFAAVARHREKDDDGGRFPDWGKTSPGERQDASRAQILGVMLSAGPYDEQAERRLRSRHAVLSALGEEGWVPEDSEHIGYFRHHLRADTGAEGAVEDGSSPESDDPAAAPGRSNKTAPPDIVPYEWLTSRRDGRRRLLLWLDEGAFQNAPLDRLGRFVEALRTGAQGAGFTLLGPYGSTTLRAMAEEMDRCLPPRGGGCPEIGDRLRGVRILSPSATISKTLARKRHAAAETLDRQFLDKQFQRLTGSTESRLVRTTGTDRDLADALIDELVRRGVDPRCRFDDEGETRSLGECNAAEADPKPAHIALVSEWDTDYGRALPCAFVAGATLGRYPRDCGGARAPGAAGPDVEPDWLHRFSYLRGFDGQLPKTPEEAAKAEGRPADAESARSTPFARPVGRRRLDYLQRLTGQLRRLDRDLRRGRHEYFAAGIAPDDSASDAKGSDDPKSRFGGDEQGLAAIGVLGSDVYDKLLILQALREEFQHIIFFTTDLDASLLHPGEYKATRNLIVVSNFGLELSQTLQGKIPPFRDGYQTSLFLSTRRALNPELETVAWGPPRIFEIGRRGAFDLSEPAAATGGSDLAHPPRRDHLAADLPENARWPLLGIALLGLIFGFFYWRAYPASRRSASKRRIRLTSASLLLGGGLALAILVRSQGPGGEPFALFDGISVWPSLYLRWFAAVLSLHFLLMSWRSIAQSDSDLEKNFLPRTAGAESDPAKPKAGEVLAWPPRKGLAWLTPLRRGLLALLRFARGLLRLGRLYFHRFHRHGPVTATTGAVTVPWARTEHGIRLPIITSDLDAPTATAQRLLRTYLHRSRLSRRLLRILPLSLAYFVLCRMFIILTGQPNVPFRGDPSYLASMATLFLAVPMLIILIFWVVDATRLSGRLTAELSSCKTEWPDATLERFGKRLNLLPGLVGEWLDIQVIARHSASIGRLLYAPVVLIVLMIASRASYFDNWAFPVGLSVVICVSVLYSIYCGATIRRSAEQARAAALRRYHSALIQAEGAKSPESSAQIRLLIDEIANLRVGAFVPFGQQPWVRAIALLFGGGGSLVLLEYLMLVG